MAVSNKLRREYFDLAAPGFVALLEADYPGWRPVRILVLCNSAVGKVTLQEGLAASPVIYVNTTGLEFRWAGDCGLTNHGTSDLVVALELEPCDD